MKVSELKQLLRTPEVARVLIWQDLRGPESSVSDEPVAVSGIYVEVSKAAVLRAFIAEDMVEPDQEIDARILNGTLTLG